MENSHFNMESSNAAFHIIDKMRGHLDATDYKNKVLPLLFLRYLNDIGKEELEMSYDIILPELADWNTIRRLSFNESFISLGQHLNNAFHELEFQNRRFDKIFSTLISNNDTQVRFSYENILIELFDFISDIKIPLSDFGDFFDSFLSSFIQAEGKSSGEFIQPKELTELMNSFMPQEDDFSMYNPFAGLASLALKLPDNSDYLGEEINKLIWAMGKLRLLAYGLNNNTKLINQDSIAAWINNESIEYDFISFNPPFNLKVNPGEYINLVNNKYFYRGNANTIIVEQCLSRLKYGGKMIFIIPDGFLSSTVRSDREFREYLLGNNYINLIISLPSNILTNTNVSISLMVLTKTNAKRDEISFIDAEHCSKQGNKRRQVLNTTEILSLINSGVSNRYFRKVKLSEIAENEFNLLSKRYIYTKIEEDFYSEKDLVSLKELIVPLKIRRTKSVHGKLVRIRDLKNDSLGYRNSFEGLEAIELRNNAAVLENDSLLMATYWKDLKPTFYTAKGEEIFYSSNDILACQVTSDLIDLDYVIIQLNADYVKLQVERFKTGNTIPRISKTDLLNIKIRVPSLKEQQSLVYEFKERKILGESHRLKSLKKEYGIDVADQNSFLRHQIAGSLKNVRLSFDSIKKIIDQDIANENREIYDLKVHDNSKLTFGKYLKMMERDLQSIHQSVLISGRKLELSNFDMKELDINKFIRDYCEELKERVKSNYTVTFHNADEDLADEGKTSVLVFGDENWLIKLFNNIVENAEKHGFSNSVEKFNKLDVELHYDFKELEVEIQFINSGNPLPINFDFENAMRKGSTYGQNGGDGTGLWYISEIVKAHEGQFDVTDWSSQSEFLGDNTATGFNIKLPIKID